MLEHLAFGAVVIDRVGRTSGDRRSVGAVVLMPRAGAMHMGFGGVMPVESCGEPRQRAE
jgi:hypothetical protein